MSRQLDIVVVIVNYNAGTWLLSCVKSILESDISCAIVVVDNASTDRSLEAVSGLAHAHTNLTLVRNNHNAGFSAAVNQVLRSTPATYYAIVNPDCVVDRHTISTVVAALERDARNGLGSCLIQNTDGTPQKTCRRSFPTPWSGFARLFGLHRIFRDSPFLADFDHGGGLEPDNPVSVEAISGAFMVAKAAAVEQVGLLDEQYFMHCEDLDWCKRFWDAGYRVVYVPGASVVHAKGMSGQGAKIRVLWHLHRGMIRFYRKFYRNKYPLPVMWLVYGGVYLRFGVQVVAVCVVSVLRPGAGLRERQAQSSR